MAHFIKNNCCKVVCISAIALSSLSSCMKDDLVGCPTSKVSLTFDYTYNVKEADAFAAEVKNLNVYVFDKNGKFLDTYMESADKFETGHRMDITDLNEGKYTFVCLARDKQALSSRADGDDNDDETEFTFTQLTPGVSTINDLQEEMGKKNGENTVNNKQFTALYTAQTSVDYKGKTVESNLSLLKCTKTYRIVLMPFENDQPGFELENFDVKIMGSAALLDFKGDKVKNKSITYLPYEEKMVTNSSGETEVEGEKIDKALVYDLSSSRMFERTDDDIATRSGKDYDDKRIVITDKRSNKVIFDHSLPWFLALCGERTEKDWGSQEYLDRQDHYVLTFYVPSSTTGTGSNYNISTKLKVNGWVLNLQDANLK
mgnify:CR=1 FL=1